MILGWGGADERSEDRPADVGWDDGTGRFAKEIGEACEADADTSRSPTLIIALEDTSSGRIDQSVSDFPVGPFPSGPASGLDDFSTVCFRDWPVAGGGAGIRCAAIMASAEDVK